MTHHLFLACNPSFLLFSEELFSDTRLSQQPTGGVHLHIEDWLAGVQRSSRQKKPLKMQNKPNLLKTLMNVSSCFTMNYEQLTINYANKNKPNSKPIKPNLVRRLVQRLVRRSFSEDGSFSEVGSLGEGGFKRDTLLLCGALSLWRTGLQFTICGFRFYLMRSASFLQDGCFLFLGDFFACKAFTGL